MGPSIDMAEAGEIGKVKEFGSGDDGVVGEKMGNESEIF